MDVVALGLAKAEIRKQAALRPRGLAGFGGLAPVADHASVTGESSQQSNGTDTGSMVRVRHDLLTATSALRIAFGNFYAASSAVGETDGTSDITVRAAVELADGTIIPLRFQGSRDVTIKSGGLVLSDLVGVGLLGTADYLYTRTYVTVTSGGRWPLTTVVDNSVRPGEGVETGTTITDKTLTGTVTVGANRAYGPVAVLGTTTTGRPLIAVVGDSIAVGDNDSITAQGGIKVLGYLSRSLGGADLPHIKLAASGETAQAWRTLSKSSRRRAFLPGCTDAIVTYGINDARAGRTLAQMQADLTAIWTELVALGIRVRQTTITPSSTSTDSYATLANQTTHATNPTRVQLNDWIRTTPAPLTSYIEVADTVESSRNSGLWKVDGTASKYTFDGLHPTTPSHLLMAAVVPTGSFTL